MVLQFLALSQRKVRNEGTIMKLKLPPFGLYIRALHGLVCPFQISEITTPPLMKFDVCSEGGNSSLRRCLQ